MSKKLNSENLGPHGFKGTFTVIDGLDGIGKGTIIQTIAKDLKKKKLKILDLHQFWKKHHDHPLFCETENKSSLFVDINSFDVILSSEPTHAAIGTAIRHEVITKNNREYSAHMTARLYSQDRMILYKRVLLPALKAGKHIIQSRSISTSIAYQSTQKRMQGEPILPISKILNLEGNKFVMQFPPDLLIIPTIEDFQDLISRLQSREKQDNCTFETIEFQKQLKPIFEGKTFKQIFEEKGSKIRYLNAGISIKETQKQAKDIFESEIKVL